MQRHVAAEALHVVLVEDSTLFREGLAALLTAAGVVVVAQLRSSHALEAVLSSNEVDVLITDVCLPPTKTNEGLVAAQRVRRAHPDIGVLLLSTYTEASWARELLDLGNERVGYLLKDRVEDIAEFLASLRRIASGGLVLDETIVAGLVSTQSRNSPIASLTERELEVLSLMAEGLSNQAISARLRVVERTVESHTAAIFAKLPLGEDDADTNRRVLAVLRYIQERPSVGSAAFATPRNRPF